MTVSSSPVFIVEECAVYPAELASLLACLLASLWPTSSTEVIVACLSGSSAEKLSSGGCGRVPCRLTGCV